MNKNFCLQTIPGQAYLKRQKKNFVPFNYPIDEFNKTKNESDETKTFEENWSTEYELANDPFEAENEDKRPLIIEHHILWSLSYSVPVMYFNGWKSGK